MFTSFGQDGFVKSELHLITFCFLKIIYLFVHFQLNEIRTSGDKVRERTAEIKRYVQVLRFNCSPVTDNASPTSSTGFV